MPYFLLYNFGYYPRAYRVSALAYREAQFFLHGYRGDQYNFELHIIAGHYHLDIFWQRYDSGDIRRPEVELWAVSVKERCMTPAFLFA